MVRCQASITKHTGLLIAHLGPRRETTKAAHSNQNRYVVSLQPRKVRRLYITHLDCSSAIEGLPTQICARASLFTPPLRDRASSISSSVLHKSKTPQEWTHGMVRSLSLTLDCPHVLFLCSRQRL